MSDGNTPQTIFVDLLGPTGVGKTIVLCSLLEFPKSEPAPAQCQGLRGFRALTDQLQELHEGRFPVQTPRIDVQPGMSPSGFNEHFGFTWTEPETGRSFRFSMTAFPGDKISLDKSEGGGVSVQKVVADFDSDPNRVLVAVVNPFPCATRLSRPTLSGSSLLLGFRSQRHGFMARLRGRTARGTLEAANFASSV